MSSWIRRRDRNGSFPGSNNQTRTRGALEGCVETETATLLYSIAKWYLNQPSSGNISPKTIYCVHMTLPHHRLVRWASQSQGLHIWWLLPLIWGLADPSAVDDVSEICCLINWQQRVWNLLPHQNVLIQTPHSTWIVYSLYRALWREACQIHNSTRVFRYLIFQREVCCL